MAQESKQRRERTDSVYPVRNRGQDRADIVSYPNRQQKLIDEINEINLIYGEDTILPASHKVTNKKRNSNIQAEAEYRNGTNHRRNVNDQRNTNHRYHRNQISNDFTDRPIQRQPAKEQSRNRMLHNRKRRKRNLYRRLVRAGLLALFLMLLAILSFRMLFMDKSEPAKDLIVQKVQEADSGNFLSSLFKGKTQGIRAAVYDRHPAWEENFLTVNEYSRPGCAISKVKNIFVHYTANPGTSAVQNHHYFEQLKDTHETSASSHFIIGYQGEIIQCIPLDEMAYAVQTRNEDSISIECCYLAQDGSFTPETYESLIRLLGWLAEAYHLNEKDILRHYDCGGKKCPLYYTEHEEAWDQLKNDVQEFI